MKAFRGVLSALVLFGVQAWAGDGVRLQDHWKSLGVSATDIELIDKLGLKRSKAEMLITSGVSIREYSHRPWEPMGITEDKWLQQVRHGSNVGQLERIYSRDLDVVEPDRPSLLGAVLLPGVAQLREGRYAAGATLAGLGLAFGGYLGYSLYKGEGSAVQVWMPLLGADMIASGADVWYNHYREQSVTGFSYLVIPTPTGAAALFTARF
ncbi:MAG: hypothetical protein IPN71_22990 [Fibrobacteres bacterium]|nr:hypothetical protein [Fibrobacterota bacterium]